MIDKETEQTIAAYDAAAQRYQQRWGGHALTASLDRFGALLPANALLLDVGCGGGRDSAALAARGFRVVGLDRSPGMLAVARAHVPPGSLLLADMRQLPLVPGVFNGVWAAATLLHLRRTEIPAALGRFCRVLRRGGVLYLSVKEGHGAGWSTHDPDVVRAPRFYTYLTLAELRGWLQESGCSIRQFWRDWPPGVARPWLTLLAARR